MDGFAKRASLTWLCGGAAFVGLAAAAPRAVAQPSAEEPKVSAPSVEEVVVTAQRRAERLQDVPISISAISPEALAQHGTQDISGLSGAIPSLTVSNTGGTSTATLIAIRGVSGQPVPIGSGQATAFYLDGVYLPRTDAGFWMLNDIERIEVLRGPQGILYGRNATAGAVNIITRSPGDVTRGNLDVSYANFDAVRAAGSVSGPLGGGFSAGLSGAFEQHDGYALNTVDSRRFPGRKQGGLRGKLRFKSQDDALDVVLTGDISHIIGGATATKAVLSATGAYIGFGDPDVVSLDAAGRIKLNIKSSGVSTIADYHVSTALDLTSISSYRELKSYYAIDVDASAAPLIFQATNFASQSIYQEFRAVFRSGSFRATSGVSYYRDEATYAAFSGAPSAPVVFNNPFDATTLNAYGVFTQLEYDVTPNLTLVGGARYNNERRGWLVDYTRGRTGLKTRGKIKDETVTPSIGINFKPSASLLLYAKAGKGYQAPGFNFAPGAAAAPNEFEAEDLKAYEIGEKADFANRTITLNTAAFYYDYSNIQIRNNVNGVTVVQNAAAAVVKGVEGSLTVRPVRGLLLDGHLTYLSATYTDFCQPFLASLPQGRDPTCGAGRADRSGNRLNQAPRWSGGASLSYQTVVTGDATLSLSASYSWESNSFYSTVNEPALSTGRFEKVDARVAVKLDSGPELYVFGRNLTGDRHGAFIARVSGTIAAGGLSDPRTYGVGMNYAF